jgi:hypothetical protein
VSPRAALAALENTEELTLEVAISLVQGLVATTESRERDHVTQVEEFTAMRQYLDERITELGNRVHKWESTGRMQNPPPGYIMNDNLSLVVPIGNGRSLPARFIRRLANGKVAMIAEHEGGIPYLPHVADIHAMPKYGSNSPFEPMPAWF